MRFAFQTVPYGRRLADTGAVLQEIAANGYEGVEFAQHPKLLGGMENGAALFSEARNLGLTVLGFVGGTLKERMDFCGEERPEYLIVDDWTDDCEEAIARGFNLALHPHLFRPVPRMEEAAQLLSDRPSLWFCPDTGHLTIAGDDPAGAIRKHGHRLVALHLKDWEPKYGRYSHRYARGFVELGRGIVKLERVLDAVKEVERRNRRSVWVVVEVDSFRVSPAHSLQECAGWLRYKHLIAAPPPHTTPNPPVRRSRSPADERELQFVRILQEAVPTGPEQFYDAAIRAVRAAIPCAGAELRIYTPALDTLELVAWDSEAQWRPAESLDCTEDAHNLSSRAIHDEQLIRFDLTNAKVIANASDPPAVRTAGFTDMVAVPVSNSWNAHHMRFLLNVFFDRDADSPPPDDELFYRLADFFSESADHMLDEQCMAAVGRILHGRWEGRTLREYLCFVRDQIKDLLNCEAVAIFMVNQNRERLEVAASTGTRWQEELAEHEKYYPKDGGSYTASAWRERRLRFLRFTAEDRKSRRPRSSERVTDENRDECLMFPFSRSPASNGSAKTLGVVRCTNKCKSAESRNSSMFTDEDAAVLDALLMAAIPQVELLQHQETHFRALTRLTHEFRNPITAIRGAAENMMRSFTEKQITPREFFGKADWLEDVWQWTELTKRLVMNADLWRGTYQGLPLHPKPTQLMSEVVAPAVVQLGILLKQRGIPHNRIKFGDFSTIPRLCLDANQFQQVIFNLLANAIKFATTPTLFQARIEGGRVGKEFLIWCHDNGPGIPEDLRSMVFEEGFRAPGRLTRGVPGDGLGLTVVEAVIHNHGGTVRVSNCRNPTTFEIALPERLAIIPPTRA